MQEQEQISIIILAGGKSSRMGTEKGLVLFRGKRLVDHVTAVAKKITTQIMIISANPAYTQTGLVCIPDALPGKGPLGGIYTGLMHSNTKKNLFLGCDMPFLTEKLLSELARQAGDEDVLLTMHKELAEPLCSVYDQRAITGIRAMLDKNQLKITDALAGLKTRTISFDGEAWFRGNEFANINSPDELQTQ